MYSILIFLLLIMIGLVLIIYRSRITRIAYERSILKNLEELDKKKREIMAMIVQALCIVLVAGPVLVVSKYLLNVYKSQGNAIVVLLENYLLFGMAFFAICLALFNWYFFDFYLKYSKIAMGFYFKSGTIVLAVIFIAMLMILDWILHSITPSNIGMSILILFLFGQMGVLTTVLIYHLMTEK